MKNILIIRSVSFQQLDLNIAHIKAQYPDYSISLLTHEHGVKLAEKYKDIDNIYVYPYKEGFDVKNKVIELENKEFDIVIVPVTNISGNGFFNVLKFSKSIHCKERIMCNVVSKLSKFSMTDIYFLGFKNILMNGISVLGTVILSPIIIITLLVKLNSIKNTNND